MSRSRFLIPVIAAAVALPALAGAARIPHLRLKASFPGKDTTLTTSPDAVRLWLSEPADLPATKISVVDAKGAAVGVAKLTRGAKADDPVVGTFTTPPGDGKYTVTWKAMSKDGHVVDGVFAFSVHKGH
ncbi:MAG: copper resistance protein CopC [Gemmatimonadaceae bacterium]|nr:copper resistance protein CopC [Gemmatimonadaceae bacterium]